MLNIDEYNESLYRSIDKRNKRKNIIQDYSGYLAHAKNYKYVYKEGDRYFYPEDIKRMKERKANLLTKKEIENAANTNSKIRALKNERSKTVEALMNARSNAELDDIVNKNRQKVAATKLMNETVAQEKANKRAKAEAARADQNARAYENNEKAARYFRTFNMLRDMIPTQNPNAIIGKKDTSDQPHFIIDNSKIPTTKTNKTYEKNKLADQAQKQRLQANSTIGKKVHEEQVAKNKAASEHEGDRWAKKPQQATKQSSSNNYSIRDVQQMYQDGKIDFDTASKMMKDLQDKEASKLQEEFEKSTARDKSEFDEKVNDMNKDYQKKADEMVREAERNTDRIAEKANNYTEQFGRIGSIVSNKSDDIFKKSKKKTGMFHSSFSISDDEMQNYLIHGSIKPEK